MNERSGKQNKAADKRREMLMMTTDNKSKKLLNQIWFVSEI